MPVLYKSSADNWRILFVLKTTLIATRFYVFVFVVALVIVVFCLKQISYVKTAAGRNSTQGQAWVGEGSEIGRAARRPHTSAPSRFRSLVWEHFNHSLYSCCVPYIKSKAMRGSSS